MPSQQSGPRPMNMPFGGGSPFGGFGGMFPQQPQQPQPPQSQVAPNGHFYGYGGGPAGTGDIAGTDPAGGPNAAAPAGPTGAFNNTMGSIPTHAPPRPMPTPGSGFVPPTMQTPMPSMNGFAPGMGRGKGRTGPGTSGGFSGGCGTMPRGMM